MASVAVNPAGVVLILDHAEIDDWSNAAKLGAAGIGPLAGGALAAAGLAAAPAAAVVAILAAYFGAQAWLIKTVDKGNGVYLTLPWPAIPLGQWWLIVPTTRPPDPGPLGGGMWSKNNAGTLHTEDGADRINWTIERGVVSAGRLSFRLVHGQGSSGWNKRLDVPDGTSGLRTTGTFEGKGQSRTVEVSTSLISNGRTLVFSKAKAFGIMTRVLSLGDNQGLMPGDRATFRWERD